MKSRRALETNRRTVKKVLADGTVKVYTYKAHSSRTKVERDPNSIAVLLAGYQRSPNWTKLSPTTQQNYTIYLMALHKLGHLPLSDINRQRVLAIRDAVATARGHGAAAGFIRASSAFFSWAIDRGYIHLNPAVHGAKDLERGHLPAWSEEQAAIAMRDLPEHLRRVVVLAVYTAARRSDLCAMRWSAYDGHTLSFVPQKTRKRRSEPLVVPCHPNLKTELDEWRKDAVTGIADATILTAPNGKPWKPTLLSHYLPQALARIGLTNEVNVHGLRKLAATNLAEAGCSASLIASITGHDSLSMVELYTRSASRRQMAEAAITKLVDHQKKRSAQPRTTAQLIPMKSRC